MLTATSARHWSGKGSPVSPRGPKHGGRGRGAVVLKSGWRPRGAAAATLTQLSRPDAGAMGVLVVTALEERRRQPKVRLHKPGT